MNRNDNIDQQVEQALSSLDGMQRAEANPFLYTRIKAKLNGRRTPANSWDKAARLVARPVFAAVVMALVFIMNYAIVSKSKARQLQAGHEIENVLSAEYATSNMYSLESVADR